MHDLPGPSRVSSCVGCSVVSDAASPRGFSVGMSPMPTLGRREFAGEGEIAGRLCTLVLGNGDVMLGIQ